MKFLLKNFHLRRAVGLYIARDSVILTEVASTLAGPVILSQERRKVDVPVDPEDCWPGLRNSPRIPVPTSPSLWKTG